MVADGQAGPEYNGIGEIAPIFSPDRKRVAYVAEKTKNWFAVVDVQAGPAYDGMIPCGPAFHPNGVLEYLAVKDRSLCRVKHSPAQ
ncbi:MAG: hypothetical protein NTU53_24425 [Planctomycetota bacterium]|nr:hypothetical protein [Planctomycetota bacterium]